MYQPQDHIQQLADYIKKNLSKGYNLDSLRFSLISQGYSKISVEKAIEIGSAAAAIVVTKVGCAPAMPDLEEILEFMKHNQINEGEK